MLRSLVAAAALMSSVLLSTQSAPRPLALDAEGEKWVRSTLRKLTLDEKIGQMLVTSFESNFMSTDSAEFERLARAVREVHVGGLHVFGGSERVPAVLLGSGYGSVTLGQPLEAASILNRLQAIAAVPLLNTADFEGGVGFRIAGATAFPRLMAFGAAGDERLAFEAGRVTGEESRALG